VAGRLNLRRLLRSLKPPMPSRNFSGICKNSPQGRHNAVHCNRYSWHTFARPALLCAVPQPPAPPPGRCILQTTGLCEYMNVHSLRGQGGGGCSDLRAPAATFEWTTVYVYGPPLSGCCRENSSLLRKNSPPVCFSPANDGVLMISHF